MKVDGHSAGHLPLFQSPPPATALSAMSPRPTSASGSRVRIKAESPNYDRNEGTMMRRPSDDRSIHGSPFLQQQREASNLELFYDLFFAANLTVFTAIHEVRDGETLEQYVGFFCILWFTWYQVGLYDVRFSADSFFERAAKAIQFLVMIGFAVVGPKYNVGDEAAAEYAEGGNVNSGAPTLEWYFRSLTLYLMISRLVLVLQYLQSMWLTRQYKQTILPMSLIAATYLAASMTYLGLFWTFNTTREENHTYVIWYIVAILETITATTISSIWRNISFKGTHLVQRMSLLTLIILGEGVIAVATKSQRIVQSEGALRFTAGTVANIICAVLILYFIYCIYFDGLEEDHFGTIMQQIWSVLHFPLHAALVLAVEGLAQCITWGAAVVRGNDFRLQYATWTELLDQGYFEEVGTQVNETSQYLIYRGLLTSSTLAETLEMLSYDLSNAANASAVISQGAQSPQLARNALSWIYFALYKCILNIAGFDSPIKRSDLHAALHTLHSQLSSSSSSFSSSSSTPTFISPSDLSNNESPNNNSPVDFSDLSAFTEAISSTSTTAGVFNLTYVYFFTSIGIVVVLCMAITGMSNRAKTPFAWFKLALGTLVGVALSLLSFADLTLDGVEFIYSTWLLPTVVACVGAVAVLHGLRADFWERGFAGRMRGRGRGGGRGSEQQRQQQQEEEEEENHNNKNQTMKCEVFELMERKG